MIRKKSILKGINLIKTFEGCELTAYYDSVGVITVGIGHTGSDVFEGLVITNDEAEKLFKQDIKTFEQVVVSSVKVKLTQNQFDALVSFAYNCGAAALQESTLLKKLNQADYAGAADQFLRWDSDGNGGHIAGLTRRRQDERTLFLT